jgi:hypothetical protein
MRRLSAGADKTCRRRKCQEVPCQKKRRLSYLVGRGANPFADQWLPPKMDASGAFLQKFRVLSPWNHGESWTDMDERACDVDVDMDVPVTSSSTDMDGHGASEYE